MNTEHQMIIKKLHFTIEEKDIAINKLINEQKNLSLASNSFKNIIKSKNQEKLTVPNVHNIKYRL